MISSKWDIETTNIFAKFMGIFGFFFNEGIQSLNFGDVKT